MIGKTANEHQPAIGGRLKKDNMQISFTLSFCMAGIPKS
jgi:hypothetical protein